MTKKVYAVCLFEKAAEELGNLVKLWLRRDEMGTYLYCKSVDPAGPYLRMVLSTSSPGEKDLDMEMQIPHAFVKCIFYAADVRPIGFTAP